MKHRLHIGGLAATILLMFANSVSATPINLSMQKVIDTRSLMFNFQGLPNSDGNGGQLSFFARGDFTSPQETASVRLDLLGGTLVLTDDGVVVNSVNGLTLARNNTTPSAGGDDNVLDYLFNIGGTLLDSLLADAAVNVGVELGRRVDLAGSSQAARDRNFIRVGLGYESARVAAVPEPGTLGLLGLGILSLGLVLKRKKIADHRI